MSPKSVPPAMIGHGDGAVPPVAQRILAPVDRVNVGPVALLGPRPPHQAVLAFVVVEARVAGRRVVEGVGAGPPITRTLIGSPSPRVTARSFPFFRKMRISSVSFSRSVRRK